MKKIEAKIVADSINPQGDRIITYLLTFPRFILAELNTHRVFSKNSASSRAIPFEKMVKMVEEDPFIPIAWQKDHKGMQGTEYITNTKLINRCEEVWLHARDNAIERACELHGDNWIEPENEHLLLDVTKQLCNRLLEPFMWHTVLITATEWDNFFKLRCPCYDGFIKDREKASFKSKKDVKKHFKKCNLKTDVVDSQDFYSWQSINTSQAEIHIQALAEAMWDARNESIPNQLNPGEWHIPFGDNFDSSKIINLAHAHITKYKPEYAPNIHELQVVVDLLSLKIASARCARLSYMTFDNEINYEKDIKLHDTLLESGHMSPFEHCAMAMSNEEYYSFIKGKGTPEHLSDALYFNSNCRGWCNNFKGFIQYRYLIENKL